MLTSRALAGLIIAAAFHANAAFAQNGAAVRDEMMRHFDESMSKVISLAAAVPGDKYLWKPRWATCTRTSRATTSGISRTR